MKQTNKVLLSVMFVLFSTTMLNAQISLGPKAGINISNLSGLSLGEVKAKSLVGFHIGGYVAFRLGGIAIQPELLYSTQGAKIEQAGNSENLKLNYFNVPVMLKLITHSGLYIETGPQLGFRTGAKFGNEDIKESVKSSDFSWDAGLGYQKNGLGLGARYCIGISKLGDASNVTPGDVDYKNGVLQFSISIALFGGHHDAK
jgi:hypothetical protein